MEYKFKMLVYGSSGVGKTVFGSTVLEVPEASPAIWIDFENRLGSIHSKVNNVTLENIGKPVAGKIDVLRVKNIEDLQLVYNKLFAMGDKSPYKTIILDSLTEVNNLFMRRVTSSRDASMRNLNLEALSNLQIDRGVYYKVQRMLMEFLSGLRDLEQYHILVTALPQEAEDAITGIEMIQPSLTGKLREYVRAAQDVVAYYSVENGKRIMRFQPKGRIVAKDATEGGKLGDVMENPTMEKIFQCLKSQ